MIARLRTFLAIIFTILSLFAMRLMYLQVVVAEEMTRLSEENVRIDARVSPLRGRILAQDGTVLADNRVAYDLMYRGGDIEHWDKLKFLLKLEEKPPLPDYTDPEQNKYGGVASYNVSDEVLLAVEELVAGQPNLYLRERTERTYPTNLAAQTVGYTAEAKGRFEGYALNELVGVNGVEASFQKTLFGTPGSMDVQVDNRSVIISQQVTKEASSGQDIVLTIDPRTQRIAEDALAGAVTYVNIQREARNLPLEDDVRGALIAMNPKTGEILAMASAPSYDQNVFTHRPSDPEKVEELLTDRSRLPMSNRAVETYPPASTFKLITSSALLEGGFLSPNKQYFCPSHINFGGIKWENWSYPSSRGTYDVRGAIADSCNPFYWYAALDTPNAKKAGWQPFIDALFIRAKEFGYGAKVGLEIPEEKAGRVPDEAWANANYEYGWLPGFTLNSVIGQGDVLATPMQVTQLAAAIAMDGTFKQPHLVKRIGTVDMDVASKSIPGQYWDVLQEGMRKMITDYGTNYTLGPASGFPVDIAGKSGTAQNNLGTGYDHTWFTSYAPMNDPDIVVTVFVEFGDKSTGVAVPTARDFYADYFELEGF